jgi:hypothetical protein
LNPTWPKVQVREAPDSAPPGWSEGNFVRSRINAGTEHKTTIYGFIQGPTCRVRTSLWMNKRDTFPQAEAITKGEAYEKQALV